MEYVEILEQPTLYQIFGNYIKIKLKLLDHIIDLQSINIVLVCKTENKEDYEIYDGISLKTFKKCYNDYYDVKIKTNKISHLRNKNDYAPLTLSPCRRKGEIPKFWLRFYYNYTNYIDTTMFYLFLRRNEIDSFRYKNKDKYDINRYENIIIGNWYHHNILNSDINFLLLNNDLADDNFTVQNLYSHILFSLYTDKIEYNQFENFTLQNFILIYIFIEDEDRIKYEHNKNISLYHDINSFDKKIYININIIFNKYIRLGFKIYELEKDKDNINIINKNKLNTSWLSTFINI